ncbi:unnamed protein product [Vicia faba]|uniref:Uncharacterized protein n=1 Tax=Vicia faba TaxID=3906 RepID=A0AAV0Z2D1_VICFA|nr:unnamed protein product [Vicia faba]
MSQNPLGIIKEEKIPVTKFSEKKGLRSERYHQRKIALHYPASCCPKPSKFGTKNGPKPVHKPFQNSHVHTCIHNKTKQSKFCTNSLTKIGCYGCINLPYITLHTSHKTCYQDSQNQTKVIPTNPATKTACYCCHKQSEPSAA